MPQELEYEMEAELEQEQHELETELEAEFEQYEAEPEIIGPDTRVRVTNTTAAPFRYICNVEYNRGSMCSGTLIGPSTVLTAGHCLSGFVPANMRVIPGRNGSLEPLPATGALSLQLAPGWARATRTDYGVIHLRHPIGIKIGYWSVGHRLGHLDTVGTSISAQPLPLEAGKLKVNLSGYPSDKPKGCPASAAPLCGTEQWRAYDRSVSSKAGILEYLNDTFPGHSGSAVWVRRDASLGGRVMIGIHISGDAPPKPVANRAVRITQPVLTNILRWLASAPVPPPFRILERFRFGKADLEAFHVPVIQQIAQRIVTRMSTPRRVRSVFLVGHADTRGPAAINLALGQKRATVVRARLTAALEALRPGVAQSIRFVTESMGETQPRFSTTTEDGRARNRRVEVMLGRI
jgi:V8-like Glu-specific endopeptidase